MSSAGLVRVHSTRVRPLVRIGCAVAASIVCAGFVVGSPSSASGHSRGQPLPDRHAPVVVTSAPPDREPAGRPDPGTDDLFEELWADHSPSTSLLEIGDGWTDLGLPVHLWTLSPLSADAQIAATGYFNPLAESMFSEEETVSAVDPQTGAVTVLHTSVTPMVGIVTGSTGESMACTVLWTDQTADHAGVTATLSTLVIAAYHQAMDVALALLLLADEGKQAVQSGGSDQIQIDCISAWTGYNGVQCCGLWQAYQAQVAACLATMHAAWLKCALVAAGGSATCLRLCMSYLTPTPFGLKGCLITCGLVGIGAYAVCMGMEYLLYVACVREANAKYLGELSTAGCYPPPPGKGPYEP